MAESKLPDNHPEVDWSNWSPPSEGDVRSPCPALNALANHKFLPHNGKGITKAMAVDAIVKGLNLDSHVAALFASGGISANPDHSAQSFDLNHLGHHGIIEHDASLSRNDVSLGDNTTFSPEVFNEVVEAYKLAYQAKHPNLTTKDSEITVDWQIACQARYARVLSSKANHVKVNKPFTYNLKVAIMSYGETSLILNILGKDGNVPLPWIEIFFREGRLPYKEGWRRPTEVVTQSKLNHGYFEMFKAHQHKNEEFKMIGAGTLETMTTIVHNLATGMIKSPMAKS